MPHPRRVHPPMARSLYAMLAVVALLLAGLSASTQPGSVAGPVAPVAAELRQQVESAAAAGAPVQALLMLPNRTALDGDPAELRTALREHARHSQAELELALEQRPDAGGVAVLNRFWVTNMLLVEFAASTQTLDGLATLPGVQRVIPNFTLTAPEPAASASADVADGEITWGLSKIGADRVWQELGVDGSGVRVATLDTGVDITHPDLAGKMVTDDQNDPSHPGGWMEFDSAGNRVQSEPHDSAYHGTHVSGTIHGGNASGVAIGGAYGAELMHGLVIPGGSGSFAQVAAGMQWAIAPTDHAGNPAGRPADVVSMSLGATGYFEEMIAPTRAMRALGTFPVFAIGNNCGANRTASPGNVYEAVGIGATDVQDNVAAFSCGGVVQKSSWGAPPADWPDSYVKPDLSAPGVDVVSASPGGGYRTLSGTSMATPHTAATVALMRSAAGDLTVEDIVTVLADTGFWDDRYASAPPDTRFGRGRINAYEATRFVALDSGVSGMVTNAATGAPVDGATITVNPGGRQLTSGADGGYTTRVEPGTYTVEVSAFGYEAATVTDVQVVADRFATVDVALVAVPSGSITGLATLDESGHGIPGVTVSVLGVPVDLSSVTGTDGSYTISDVPAGTYQVAATHPRFQAPQATEVTVAAGGAARADFAFGRPPDSVAVVDSSATRAAQYRDVVFAPRGIHTEIYDWTELDQAAQHKTVVLGYGTLSINYDPVEFQAFLDATDANGTGVIFTDHAFGTGSGIKQLSAHTGQPASIGTSTGGSNSAESYYEVSAEHPMLDGYQVGDRIVIDNSTQAKWVAWFDGYQGEGRRTLGGLGRTADGVLGGGIGVDERANNRHVLLSTHGTSGTRGPADWTEQATDLFLDAIGWASPPPAPNQPFFATHALRLSADLVKVGDPVTAEVGVTNVGGSTGTYNAVLQVNGTPEQARPVTLDSGESATVRWTLDPDDLGTYSVRIEHMSAQFRVRAPIVDLAAVTADAPGAQAVGPLAGATVELLDQGRRTTLGSTDANGRISFEIPDPVGRYTVVVRRDQTDDGGPAYLLHREITVIDDDAVSFAPRVLAGTQRGTGSIGSNFAVRAELALDQVDGGHSAAAFLRPSGTAPYGYRYEPGTLIASLDHYEAVTVHEVSHLEQDWFLPSRLIDGIDWIDPYDVRLSFGGPAQAELTEVTVADNGAVTVDWTVADAHGNPFATVLATDLRPFVDLPSVVELEDIEGLLRAQVPNELKPILRLFDPDGAPVRAGSIDWAAQPYRFTFDPEAPNGVYRLALEVRTGGYSDTIGHQVDLRRGPAPVAQVELSTTRPDTVEVGTAARYDVRAVNSGTADSGPLAWTVRVANAGPLAPRDVVLRLQTATGWQRVELAGDGTGGLVGTVTDGVALAAGATHTWRMSLQVRGAAGEYTVTDSFTGTGVAVESSGRLTVISPDRQPPARPALEEVAAQPTG